jgi:hypothetical protein
MSPVPSNRPGYGARPDASAATGFPGRYPPVVLPVMAISWAVVSRSSRRPSGKLPAEYERVKHLPDGLVLRAIARPRWLRAGVFPVQGPGFEVLVTGS